MYISKSRIFNFPLPNSLIELHSNSWRTKNIPGLRTRNHLFIIQNTHTHIIQAFRNSYLVCTLLFFVTFMHFFFPVSFCCFALNEHTNLKRLVLKLKLVTRKANSQKNWLRINYNRNPFSFYNKSKSVIEYWTRNFYGLICYHLKSSFLFTMKNY